MKKIFLILVLCVNIFSSQYECAEGGDNFSTKSSHSSCNKAKCIACRQLGCCFDGKKKRTTIKDECNEDTGGAYWSPPVCGNGGMY